MGPPVATEWGPIEARLIHRVCNADRIVRGTVTAVGTSRWDQHSMVTPITFAIDLELDGSGPLEIELLTPGGEVEGVRGRVAGESTSPERIVGSSWLLALSRYEGGWISWARLRDPGLDDEALRAEATRLRSLCVCDPETFPKWLRY